VTVGGLSLIQLIKIHFLASSSNLSHNLNFKWHRVPWGEAEDEKARVLPHFCLKDATQFLRDCTPKYFNKFTLSEIKVICSNLLDQPSVMDWRPVQGVPRLSPDDCSSTPATRPTDWRYRKWMDRCSNLSMTLITQRWKLTVHLMYGVMCRRCNISYSVSFNLLHVKVNLNTLMASC